MENVGMWGHGFTVSTEFSLQRTFAKRNKRAAEYNIYLPCFQYLVPVSPGEKVIDLAGLLKESGRSLLKCMFCHSCFRLHSKIFPSHKDSPSLTPCHNAQVALFYWKSSQLWSYLHFWLLWENVFAKCITWSWEMHII